MKSETKALRSILNAVNLSEEIESLKLYAAATAVANILETQIEDSQVAGSSYILEKLDLFISYFHYAVIPSDGTAHSPAGWLTAAGDNLLKVEMKVESA